LGIGLRHGEAASGVPQHSGRQVDPDRRPAQLAEPGGVDAGATADLQADAAALAEQVAQGAVDAEGIGVCSPPLACCLPRNSCSYQSAISS